MKGAHQSSKENLNQRDVAMISVEKEKEGSGQANEDISGKNE